MASLSKRQQQQQQRGFKKARAALGSPLWEERLHDLRGEGALRAGGERRRKLLKEKVAVGVQCPSGAEADRASACDEGVRGRWVSGSEGSRTSCRGPGKENGAAEGCLQWQRGVIASGAPLD